ncbi:HlyD family efflux transporter periplasmic adaptor subunit [Suttonella ornithocola]|uniref:Macrolide-specific efflux protein macA n=1 Tax=Suttonella ornithocola TaxID=279832 RepID=A0A380MQB8_9GAMM|nr:HlyD family efflux transporter periplasmic adaptor subunit [Suttonella ornithocola]SUO93901.1 Macrolide-specific efflux protein macA precursor [Suttonella ornithocola]
MSAEFPMHRGLRRRTRNLLLLTLIFLLIGGAIAYLYFTQWQYHVDTEDAYVHGDLIQITAQINGQVQTVSVENTDSVQAGDLLVSLDLTDAQLALEVAKTHLSHAVRQYRIRQADIAQTDAALAQTRANIGEVEAQVNAANVRLKSAQNDYARRRKLANSQAISAEEVSHAKEAVTAAQAQLATAQAQLNAARARIATAEAQKRVAQAALGSQPLKAQPDVQAAISEIRQAWLKMQRTEIRAPLAGEIARRNVQPGQQIAAGTPLMAVVPLNRLWVEANFKESQLKTVHPGQKVKLTSDLYGDEVVFNGIVEGISAGTGSAFSVLPAQNATGNWIKVVQRVPVRIALNADEVAQHPLRIGLSMKAEIDTRDHSDTPLPQRPIQALPSTMGDTLSGAQEIIDELLK